MTTIELAREPAFQLGTAAVHPATRELVTPPRRQVLEPRVMQVLVALARANGEIVTRDDLAVTCWDGRVVGEDALNRVISKLRQLSEGAARGAFTIETITKVGYRLVRGDAAAAASATPYAVPRSTHWRPRRIWIAGAALAVVAIAILAVVFMPGAPQADHRQVAASPASAAVDPVAYELYRRAVDFLRQRTDGATTQAIALLQQAISRAPNFSRAWSSLAFAQMGLSNRGASFGPLKGEEARWENAAIDSARRAIALDPHNGEPYGVLGLITAQEQGDGPGLALLNKGIAIEPNNVYLVRSRGQVYLTIGLAEDAVADFRRAHQLDPIDPRAFANLSNALIASGHVAEGRSVLNRGFELYPTYWHIWRQEMIARLSDGQFDTADVMLAPKAVRPDGIESFAPEWRLIVHALRTNDAADVETAMAPLRADVKAGESISDLGWSMWLFALLGRDDEAYALSRPDLDLDYERYVDAVFAHFRRDPRFMTLWKRHFAYWRASGRWPTFCDDPTLPYKCETEVHRLMPGHT